MSEELKRCPFCGNADFTVITEEKMRANGKPECDFSPFFQAVAHCDICGARTAEYENDSKDKAIAKAVAAWDARPIEDELEQKLYKLKLEYDGLVGLNHCVKGILEERGHA